MSELMNGNEKFKIHNKKTDMSMLEFWQMKYSNIYDIQDSIAEYIVAKALGKEKLDNTDYWTLYDIDYHGVKIEIKETAYYHAFNEAGAKRSQVRTFDIGKRYSKYKDSASDKERQCDIYVFCLNIGNEKEDSYPLEMDNWEFYVVSRKIIDDNCGDNKTINLNKVRTLTEVTEYSNLRTKIDQVIKEIGKQPKPRWLYEIPNPKSGGKLRSLTKEEKERRERRNKVFEKAIMTDNPIKYMDEHMPK